MTDFIDEVETMEFSDQLREGFESWIQVQLREPKSTRQPYNMDKHSIYITMWEGERTGIFLTTKQARKLALWLIDASDIIDERNGA